MKKLNQNFTGQNNCPKCGKEIRTNENGRTFHRDSFNSCDSCEVYWARKDNVDRGIEMKGDKVIWRYKYPQETKQDYLIQWEE